MQKIDHGPLPPAFRLVRLERGREPAHPEGDAGTGYVMCIPLTADGFLDPDVARDHRDSCKVLRFRRGQENEHGILRRRPGGSWAIHYEEGDVEDDDPGYRLGEHRFVVGEYLTIHEDDDMHTYRVVSITMPGPHK